MVNTIALAGLLMGLIASPSSLRAAQAAQLSRPCLHGRAEQPGERARRDQAVRMAQQINRAEHGAMLLPLESGRTYRPFEQLRNVPPAPAGFHVQFHTDGASYAFSLKDTRDSCGYAIFSDQDAEIYEATPRMGARVVPVETR